jgi:hypothetical protein
VPQIVEWASKFLIDAGTPGSTSYNAHGAFMEQYIVDQYVNFGVIPANSSYESIIGLGIGASGVFGYFEKQKADIARAEELERTSVTVLYCTVLHCTVLHCTVLHCTALYCTALYCTAL